MTDPPERTAILRPAHSTEMDSAVRQLERYGARVQSAGPGAIVVAADDETLERISDLPWVRAVERPRRLDMKVPGDR